MKQKKQTLKLKSNNIILAVRSVLLGALIGFAAGCLLYAALILFRNQGKVEARLKEWKLLPMPETLTELYFEDHLKLAQYLDSSKPYKFSFTIHNLEYKTMTYRYRVTATSAQGSSIWDEGEVSIPHDAKRTISESIFDKILRTRTKVEVILVDQNQPIHFWLDKWNPPTPTVPVGEI